MRAATYVWRSLAFHRRVNAGVLLGAALASAVLTGALIVGDSVRHSLEWMTLARLGATETALTAGGLFFRAGLADLMAAAPGVDAAPILLLNGVALSPEGDHRIREVQVVGVDERFTRFAPEPDAVPGLDPDSVWVNDAFAARMDAEVGDTFVLRVRSPGGVPAELTLAPREDDIWSRRLRIGHVVGPDAFGRFTLRATQASIPTVFVPLSRLAAELDVDGRANILLLRHGPEITRASLEERLNEAWTLADAGLRIARLPDGAPELQSDRVFIEDAVAEAVRAVDPDAQPILTYLVNRIENARGSVPYAFASAPGPPRVPRETAADEVWVSDWVAEDLALEPGDRITLRYYAVDSGRRLDERDAAFTVAGIIKTASVAEQDRALAPHIPGLTDADHCRDWDPGIPIDLGRIRARDEAYWEAFGPTPKLYLTETAAQRLWSNRYGSATAFRFSMSSTPDEWAGALRGKLDPGALGFDFFAAREEGLAASRQAVDFGQLFIGLSFFLIAGAVLLTALLFGFNIETRSTEIGTLRAMGFPSVTIRRWLWLEGCVVVVMGAAVGAVLAIGYNRIILWALETVWRDAVRMSVFRPAVRPASLGIGVLAIIGTGLLAVTRVLRKQTRAVVRELHQGLPEFDRGPGPGKMALAAGALGLTGALAIVAVTLRGTDRDAVGAFFAAGFLLLGSFLLCAYGVMRLGAGRAPDGPLTRPGLIFRGMLVRRSRSLACVALLALGVFLVIAVAANRRGTVHDPADRASGTGGFAVWGQSTLPVPVDGHPGRSGEAQGRSEAEDPITLLRLREGDDASCLNLHRVTRPHLLGIDPEAFSHRKAFTFVRWAEGVAPADPWRILAEDLGPDVLPAVADQADITWGLGLSVGDTLHFTDEAGRPFDVRLVAGLANSVFQGHLLVSEPRLAERFPTQSALRVMLIDVPADETDQRLAAWTRQWSDYGWAGVRTEQRLAEFDSVENTYLSVFMLLGGLGVLIGSAGMGVVAARNILERRAELALLRAVGFRARDVRRLVFLEHGLLAAAGAVAGGVAAVIAAAPALLAPGAGTPWGGVAVTLAVVLAGSMVWIGAAVRLALRRGLLPALRNE